MDKEVLKLKVLEREKEMTDEVVEEKANQKHKITHPNQTNPQTCPILKKMMEFHNEKIGEKLSVKDILRG